MTNGTKIAIGGIVILLLGGYALWAATRSTTPAPVDTTPSGGQVGGTSAPSESVNPNMGTPGGMMGGGGMMSRYKDGSYTGSVGSAAPYGTVQVKATISGGKITKIDILQAPHGPGHTDEVTAFAFPALVKEALTIQSANVNIVSGATQDSEGFQQSLSSALAQAKA